MSKTVKILVIGLLLLTLTSVLVYQFFGTASPEDKEQEHRAEQVDETEQQLENVENTGEEKKVTPSDQNKTEMELPLNMKEYQVIAKIHHMTHQKVKANSKRGHFQITPERIERLIEVVKANERKYEHSDLFLEILNKWTEGDFSNSVYAHNSIWKILEGEVGEATGLMTAEQEKRYIKKHFE